MGTTYNIKVVVDSYSQATAQTLKQEIDAELLKFNQVMSTYIGDSEISKFNQAKSGQWISVSKPFMDILVLSQSISAQSDGAFDITVGPLVNLWGFGPEARPDKVPSNEEISQARLRTGFRKLVLDPAEKRLKKDAVLYVDLSAVAKGDGVDYIAQFLRSKGYNDFMVEIGGELYLSGVNAKGEAWRIGIVSPEQGNQTPAEAVSLSNLGMATSGDYRNYYEENGQRYSHTIDPKTGKPITHKLASVTVIAESSAKADAWATAFSVMGGDRAMAKAEALGMAIYLIERQGEKFTARSTETFKAYLQH